jgi:hypothetical protein
MNHIFVLASMEKSEFHDFQTFGSERDKRYFLVPLILSSVALAIQIATNTNYGIFTDELYYIACGNHLQFGYVDHPAIAPLLTRVSMLFGKSLVALRFFPALAGSLTILLSALITRELGGSQFAAALSSSTILFGMVFWVMFGMMGVNAFDILFVTLTIYFFLKALESNSLKYWIAFGLSAGIGLNTKLTMLSYGFGLLVGLVCTGKRKLLLSRNIWIGGLITSVMFLPFLFWQMANNWPTLEFIRNVSSGKNLILSPLVFVFQMALGLNLFTFPLWCGGLVYLFIKRGSPKYRVLAIATAVFLLSLLLTHSKSYYALPAMPLLLSAGSTAFSEWTTSARRAWIRPAYIALLSLLAVVMLPFGIPILPIETVGAYAQKLGGTESIRMERNEATGIPQYYADRFGCRELAQSIASVYHSLPDSDKQQCGILGAHYSDAGGVDYFGEEFGLPEAVSRHNSYWLWGPKQYTGKIMIVVESPGANLSNHFRTFELRATYRYPYGEGENRLRRILLCRDSKEPLPQMWPKLKTFD